MEKTVKIFISCALGALIGTMVALQLNAYLWWIGLLIGGLVGYLSYDFKEVIVASRQAWRETTGWRLEKGWWKVLGLGVFTSIIVAASIALCFVPLFLWRREDIKIVHPLLTFLVMIAGMIGGMAGIVWLFANVFCLQETLRRKERTFDYKEDMEFVMGALIYLNPITVYFYLIPLGLFRLTKVIVSNVPNAVATLLKFIKLLFLLIHSDVRLLCGVDAALGTAVGYFVGNAIVGMLAGGVLGVINYKVISIKILRLNLKT